MKKVTSQWLEEISKEFRQNGITDGHIKTCLAVEKWRKENAKNSSQISDSDIYSDLQQLNKQIDEIKLYFLTQSEKDRGIIDIQFVGIFYYLGSFWQLEVPFCLGRSGVRIFDQLIMPNEVRQKFYKDKISLNEYISVWEDSCDYGYGIKEVESKCKTDDSKELFRSADKHLRSTISLLNQEKANAKAIEDARMAVEIFLKAFLSVKENLTDQQLKDKFNHFLEKPIKHRYITHGLFDSSITHGLNDLIPIKKKLTLFPSIESRYKATEWTLGELWTTYRLALQTGTTVLRNLTKRDTKGALKRQQYT